jgi:ribonuclease T1
MLALGIILLLWVVSQYLGGHPHDADQGHSTQGAARGTIPQNSRSEEGLYQQSGHTVPKEARQTIELIKKGGPFLHEQDGVTFFNRERKLPQKPKGYYHEYTVPTPGLHHRGARRLVTGSGGELYYTDDHYRTFTKLAPP